jgi:tryptophan 2,3-dioxygenase
MAQPHLNDNSPELQTVVHRLNRINTILQLLVQQIEVMETMTPMDFLEFRDMLRPASGFQSWQFKQLEAKLGLQFEHRHGKEYYTAQLKPEHVELIKRAEAGPSLLYLLNHWLERMPFFKEEALWKEFIAHEPRQGVHPFWSEYRYQYRSSLAEAEKENGQFFDDYFLGDTVNPERILSREASRAALFIMLYRGYPMLQLPFQLLNGLIEVDVQLSSWRYRHMNMVHRMIGTRIGTGGSSGKDYLKSAADKHYIYRDLAQLTSFLIERKRLPILPAEVSKRLGFS